MRLVRLLAASVAVAGSLLVGPDLFAAGDKDAPPSEADVTAAFAKTHRNGEANENTLKFDGPMKVAPPMTSQQRTIVGKTVYPVKVDFTVAWIFKNPVWPRTTYTHWKGGVYEFYRDSFGDWQFIIEQQPDHTMETVNQK